MRAENMEVRILKQRFQTIDGETLMSLRSNPSLCGRRVDRTGAASAGRRGEWARAGWPFGSRWQWQRARGVGYAYQTGHHTHLCLEDSTIRIQNRLFEITEDAPPCVHFTTEAQIIGAAGGTNRNLYHRVP